MACLLFLCPSHLQFLHMIDFFVDPSRHDLQSMTIIHSFLPLQAPSSLRIEYWRLLPWTGSIVTTTRISEASHGQVPSSLRLVSLMLLPARLHRHSSRCSEASSMQVFQGGLRLSVDNATGAKRRAMSEHRKWFGTNFCPRQHLISLFTCLTLLTLVNLASG